MFLLVLLSNGCVLRHKPELNVTFMCKHAHGSASVYEELSLYVKLFAGSAQRCHCSSGALSFLLRGVQQKFGMPGHSEALHKYAERERYIHRYLHFGSNFFSPMQSALHGVTARFV